jgi:AraC-like DNA-binding protein
MAETAGTTMFLDPSATWAPARGIWVTSMEAWVDAERTAYVIETLELVARSPDQDPESFGRRIEAWLRGRLPASAAIKDFANALSVSEATLRRMARTELGLNVQTYYRWVRLLVAIEGVAAGLSITDAAHAAGFADGSHATRASREMFGLSPSDALAHLHIIKG